VGFPLRTVRRIRGRRGRLTVRSLRNDEGMVDWEVEGSGKDLRRNGVWHKLMGAMHGHEVKRACTLLEDY
jgi:hypothetical protein